MFDTTNWYWLNEILCAFYKSDQNKEQNGIILYKKSGIAGFVARSWRVFSGFQSRNIISSDFLQARVRGSLKPEKLSSDIKQLRKMIEKFIWFDNHLLKNQIFNWWWSGVPQVPNQKLLNMEVRHLKTKTPLIVSNL